MKEDLRISKKPGFLLVQGSRTISPSSMQHFLSRITDAAHEADTSKVLVDARRTKGSLSTTERFEYATRLIKHLGVLKVAFVLHKSLQDPDLFGEKVAVNRGGNIRVFTNLKEAYEWLEINPANKTAGGDA